MFYATRVNVPDAFFYLDLGDQAFVFLDHRELGVFEEKNKNSKIKAVLLNPYLAKVEVAGGEGSVPCRLALLLAREYKLDKLTIEVPTSLPLDMADFLRANGVKLVVKNPFFPEREIKSTTEVAMIEDSLKRTQITYQKIEEILTGAKMTGNTLVYKSEVLTSEILKREVDMVLLQNDMLNTMGIIISSADQAAIPHHEGHGPICPNQPIICDIFPVRRTTGYFADMTRTYVKGQASEAMVKIYDTVKRSQEAGIAAIKPGVKGSEVHKICSQVFVDAGYEVGDRGFIHGTGHGLGLDVHEGPYLRAGFDVELAPGNVVTVEPGLYYKDKGSARIEDVVVVTENGCRNLTNYPKILEIA